MKSVINSVKSLHKELKNLPGICQQKVIAPEQDIFDKLITDKGLRLKVEKLFRDGHHSRAVEEAYKYLDNTVLRLAQLHEGTGSSLMKKVFSANNPVIKINSGTSRSEQDEQLGYMEIYSGSMTGIRNPRAHDCDWEDSEERALQLLILANHLVTKVKNACDS
jgi:uncharacterized protein (TIGR02391 family)